ncbi:MAG: SDR family NAD(P)-dependent oxidoreductase [Alphaproteobacteria bacterium]|nr:SDR family NAD(P)-dependent oxidoreductase [Alphaproteobacteria bacterium]
MVSTATRPLALVIGAGGGIGRAVADHLRSNCNDCDVRGFTRESEPPIDLTLETSIEEAARSVSNGAAEICLIFVATGFLHDDAFVPERSLGQLNREHMLKSFEINAIGPALVMKHFLPLLPRSGRSVFAVLSARVGSIEDNRLGGWYSYRASKAALNQLVRTSAIELKRTKPEAICVAVHPGTTDTPLSAPFVKSGLDAQSPGPVAERLVALLGRLSKSDSGSFLDYSGATIPW